MMFWSWMHCQSGAIFWKMPQPQINNLPFVIKGARRETGKDGKEERETDSKLWKMTRSADGNLEKVLNCWRGRYCNNWNEICSFWSCYKQSYYQNAGKRFKVLQAVQCWSQCVGPTVTSRMQRIVGKNHSPIYHPKLLLLLKPSYDSMSESMIHFLREGIPAEEMNRLHKFRQTAQREKHPASEF